MFLDPDGMHMKRGSMNAWRMNRRRSGAGATGRAAAIQQQRCVTEAFEGGGYKTQGRGSYPKRQPENKRAKQEFSPTAGVCCLANGCSAWFLCANGAWSHSAPCLLSVAAAVYYTVRRQNTVDTVEARVVRRALLWLGALKMVLCGVVLVSIFGRAVGDSAFLDLTPRVQLVGGCFGAGALDLALGVAWWFETEFLKDLFAGGILKGIQLQGMHVDLPRMKLVPTLSGCCRRQKS